MKQICPNPSKWNEIHKKLIRHSNINPCKPPKPPAPLILAAWDYSNDVEKEDRWIKTIQWAEKNNCTELTSSIPHDQFYCVKKSTNFIVGPMGGPMYRSWDYETKECPPTANLKQYIIENFL